MPHETAGFPIAEQNPYLSDVHRMLIQGAPVDRVTMEQVVARALRAAAGHDQQISIFAMNPEKVVKAGGDPQLLKLLSASELLIPDGIGCVLAMRLRGWKAQRVPGSELMPALCEAAARDGHSVFLLGARPEVNAEAARRLRERFPQLIIAGRQHGYFEAREESSLLDAINDSGASMLFVAMGSPKQEEWMARHRQQLSVKVLQGVGGTFDVLAGAARRAPEIWLRLNLEWLYRLLSQPQRLLRQRALPLFAVRLIGEWVVGLPRRTRSVKKGQSTE